MQQQKVPQNIEREDQIIGPITLKQLIILGAGGGVAYAIYISLAETYFIEVWLPPVAIVSLLTLAFAFLRIHNLSFYTFLINLFEYKILPKKRYWIKGSDTPLPTGKEKPEQEKKIQQNQDKPKPNIEEITEMLDSYGKEKQEKHEKLNQIINQDQPNG
ncbi:hypothetical protein CVV38_03465 [Candidatus Peregrinibacteria bacterium HGW-Peregrinibacteria-1]|jgi:hypothetical protein|nr:MAG: hypothetical protein CVV38_03465 [Candidatus Peregrinibacteria bacterium HGW-Peregrinibacteria-1]